MSGTERVLQGDLSRIFVPKILNFLSEASKTGVLTLTSGDRQIQVHFLNGQAVFVSSGFMPGLGLADFLAARKILSPDVLGKAHAEAIREKKRLGVYLVEQNLISARDLFETMNLQVKAKLFRAFTWVQGEFTFREGEIVERQNQNLSINLPNIIYEGIRDYVPMDKLPTEFRGRKDDPLFRRPNPRLELGDIKMKASEIRLIKLVDGKRSLRELVALSQTPKKEAYKVLYALYTLGFIGFAESLAAAKRAGKTGKAPAPRTGEEEPAASGFAIRVSDDLIAQAVASVERISKIVREARTTVAEKTTHELSDQDEACDVDQAVREAERSARRPRPAEAQSRSEPDDGLAFRSFAEEQVPEAAADTHPPLDLDLPEDSASPAPPAMLDLDAPEEAPAPPRAAFVEPNAPREATTDQPIETIELLSTEGGPGSAPPAGEGPVARMAAMAETHDRAAMPESAEEMAKQAQFYIDQGACGEAVRILTAAQERFGGDPRVQTLLAWAKYTDAGGGPAACREAEKILKDAIRADPKNWRAFLYLGKIYMAEKQRDFAELHFVRAVELNPECAEAKEGIRQLYR